MALVGAAYPGGSTSIVNKTNADKFIPEIWSDEVIAAYKKKLLHRLASLKRSCHSQLKESGLLNSLRCIHMRDRRKRVRQKLPRL